MNKNKIIIKSKLDKIIDKFINGEINASEFKIKVIRCELDITQGALNTMTLYKHLCEEKFLETNNFN